MEITLHLPVTPEAMEQLKEKAAATQADLVVYYINHLSCPIEQKLSLMQSICMEYAINHKCVP